MRFTIDFRNCFPDEMRQKYFVYSQHVHPFNIDKDDIYQYGWEKDELAALQLLVHTQADRGFKLRDTNRLRTGCGQIICMGGSCIINCQSLADKRSYLDSKPLMFLNMGDYPFPNVEFDDTTITDVNLRGKLLAWVAERARHNAVDKEIEHKLRLILDRNGGVNTPGQLFRIWPEVACVMPKSYRTRVVGAKLKSALPGEWDEADIVAFRQGEHFESINNAFLAMTVMDDLKTVEDYPSVR